MTQELALVHAPMVWPATVEAAVAFLRGNLSVANLATIEHTPQDELPNLYAHWSPYVIKQSACLTREVAEDIGINLDPEGLERGASFLLYLLWKQLQAEH